MPLELNTKECIDLKEGRYVRIINYQPLWGMWLVKELIGNGTTSAVYRVENSLQINSALKVITIGYDGNKIVGNREKWRQEKKDAIMQEIKLLSELRGYSNIVSFEDFFCAEIFDNDNKAIGYDILIRMELLESLSEKMNEGYFFSEEEIIKIGIDIVNALRDGYDICKLVHRDIKPDNIFINKSGYYKLGDFGVSTILEDQEDSMKTCAGTGFYMAPEVYVRKKKYQANIDVYSLGIVLYQLANKNRLPFVEENMSINEIESVNKKRLQGDKVPELFELKTDLKWVISKACKYRPEKRYKNIDEMQKALTALFNEKKKQNLLYYILPLSVIFILVCATYFINYKFDKTNQALESLSNYISSVNSDKDLGKEDAGEKKESIGRIKGLCHYYLYDIPEFNGKGTVMLSATSVLNGMGKNISPMDLYEANDNATYMVYQPLIETFDFVFTKITCDYLGIKTEFIKLTNQQKESYIKKALEMFPQGFVLFSLYESKDYAFAAVGVDEQGNILYSDPLIQDGERITIDKTSVGTLDYADVSHFYTEEIMNGAQLEALKNAIEEGEVKASDSEAEKEVKDSIAEEKGLRHYYLENIPEFEGKGTVMLTATAIMNGMGLDVSPMELYRANDNSTFMVYDSIMNSFPVIWTRGNRELLGIEEEIMNLTIKQKESFLKKALEYFPQGILIYYNDTDGKDWIFAAIGTAYDGTILYSDPLIEDGKEISIEDTVNGSLDRMELVHFYTSDAITQEQIAGLRDSIISIKE